MLNLQGFATVRACDGSAALRQPRKKASENNREGRRAVVPTDRIWCAGARSGGGSVLPARRIASTRAHRPAAHAASETRRIPRGSTLESTSRRSRDLYPRGAGAVPPETPRQKTNRQPPCTSAACVPLRCARIRARASILRARVFPRAPSRAFARGVARAPRSRLGQTPRRDEKTRRIPFDPRRCGRPPPVSFPPAAPHPTDAC